MPFAIAGTLQEPRVTMDSDALERAAQKSVQRAVEKEIGKQLGRLFGGEDDG